MGNDNYLRLIFFIGMLTSMCLWEVICPRRKLQFPRKLRWFSNLSIVALNIIILRVLLPWTAIGVALLVQQKGIGLFNLDISPWWVSFFLSLVFLDFTIYWQHRLFHKIPLFWKIHRMHHTDMDLDVTSGSRFHPVEILLSMLIKMAVIAILGAPPESVLVFEVILNSMAMFNHANIYIPPSFDKVLRYFVVTPDMHRIHHSVLNNETNSNYGFNLALWDRIFGSYRKDPAAGQSQLTLGLPGFLDSKYLSLTWLLKIPFLKP